MTGDGEEYLEERDLTPYRDELDHILAELYAIRSEYDEKLAKLLIGYEAVVKAYARKLADLRRRYGIPQHERVPAEEPTITLNRLVEKGFFPPEFLARFLEK